MRLLLWILFNEKKYNEKLQSISKNVTADRSVVRLNVKMACHMVGSDQWSVTTPWGSSSHHCYVSVSRQIVLLQLLPSLAVYMEFAFDNYQSKWWRDFPLPLLKEQESGYTGKKLPLTCCVYSLDVCDIFYRYKHYNCSEMLLLCWYDCLLFVFRFTFIEKCRHIHINAHI